MTSLESLFGNNRERVFQTTSPYLIYYHSFGESSDTGENFLIYGDDFINSKFKTVDEYYLVATKNYIGAEIVLAGKYSIPVLAKVKTRKGDENNLPIRDANPNPILDTHIYELEFLDCWI